MCFRERTIGGVGRCCVEVDDGVVIVEVGAGEVELGLEEEEGTGPIMIGMQTEGGREDIKDADGFPVLVGSVDDGAGVEDCVTPGVVVVVVVGGVRFVFGALVVVVVVVVTSGYPFSAPSCACRYGDAREPGEGVNADFIASGVFVKGGGNGPPPAFTLLFSGGSNIDAPPFLLFPAVTLIPFTCGEVPLPPACC